MITFEDGMGLYGPQLNAMFAALRGTAVFSGCVASATGTNRVVSVTAGKLMVNDAAVAYAGGSVTLDAGSAFDRYDLITISATGALAATKGTEAKKCPAQPANTCLIAIVRVPAGAAVVATGNVIEASVTVKGWTPPGGIIEWSGAVTDIWPGWALCDGSNGTPDLRDRFVVGAGSGYAVGATGGEAAVTLTVAQMPTHSHTYSMVSGEGGSIKMEGSNFGSYTRNTGPAGEGKAHENRPPYYALAYIMRLP